MALLNRSKNTAWDIEKEIIRYIFFTFTAILLAFLFFALNRLATENFVLYKTEASPISTDRQAPFQPSESKTKPRTIGFLPSWNINDELKLHFEYLDEIIYFGLSINKNGVLEKYDEENAPLIEWSIFTSSRFKEIQKTAKETNTKVLVSIKNFDNESIDAIISAPYKTSRAIREIIGLVDKYDLDGVNIDFEYFTQTDFPTLKYYNAFLTELNTKLKEQNSRAILSVDVNATAVFNDNAYDIVKIGDVVDEVIIMGYDYHILSSSVAGPVAPIAAKSDENSLTKTLDSIKGRIDPEKVILALPFYGYEWQTYTDRYGSQTVPETGALASYKRVHDLLAARKDFAVSYDVFSQSPRVVYRHNGQIKQIYFDDAKSLEKKFEFSRSYSLKGVGFWALGYEGVYLEPWELIKKYRSGL